MTRDNFINSLDWLSVINDSCSYDDMVGYIRKYTNISFNERYVADKKYIVVEKDSYREFLDFYEQFLSVHCRFTRIDIKFDLAEKYSDIIQKRREQLNWSTGIVENNKEGKFNTIYFNSRGSDMFCRFYDKQKEANLDFPLSRLEYEIKGHIALNFSERYKLLGLPDALNYLLNFINDFNYQRGIGCLIGRFDNPPPYSLHIIEKKSKVEKMRRFLKQYRHTIKDYVDCIGLENFMNLCSNMQDFDEIIKNTIGV